MIFGSNLSIDPALQFQKQMRQTCDRQLKMLNTNNLPYYFHLLIDDPYMHFSNASKEIFADALQKDNIFAGKG